MTDGVDYTPILRLGSAADRDALEREIEAELEQRRQGNRRIWTAVMLARDLDTAQALLAGEHVPRHRIDPKWLHLLERWPKAAA